MTWHPDGLFYNWGVKDFAGGTVVHMSAGFAALAGAMVSGCLGLHARARTANDSPPLSTPPAPPRVIETVEAQVPPPASLVEEPPRQPIRPPARPQPKVEAPQPRPVDPPKPEPEQPVVAETPPKPPPTTLQTTPAVVEAELEGKIRNTIARANQDLTRVDYRALNGGGKSQYDTAKRFIQQSEEALRPPRNVKLAQTLAEKAASLATQLAGR